MPKVFVIIINFNGWPDTEECLASLSRVAYDNFEVVLIDNASKEPMPFIPVIPAPYQVRGKTPAGIQAQNSELGSLPTGQAGRNKFGMTIRQIFNQENLGFAGANNQGIKLALESNADYVLLLNNDTTVEPDFLIKLVEEAENDESAGIVGPLIYFYDAHDKIWSAGGKITNHGTRGELIAYNKKDEGEYLAPEQVDYISGTCLLIKTEVIKKIGPISEDYFLYYEDNDWCVRAKKAGCRSVVVPQAKIYHKASQSTVEFSYPYIYYHSRNGLMFGERFGSKLVVPLMSVWIFLKQIGKLAFNYKKDWAKPVLRGVWDFWRGKKGKLEGYY